jgi:hypothetical protein
MKKVIGATILICSGAALWALPVSFGRELRPLLVEGGSGKASPVPVAKAKPISVVTLLLADILPARALPMPAPTIGILLKPVGSPVLPVISPVQPIASPVRPVTPTPVRVPIPIAGPSPYPTNPVPFPTNPISPP